MSPPSITKWYFCHLVIDEYHVIGPANRNYLRYTKEAIQLLGLMIRSQRKMKKISEMDFAERVGIARTTLQKIEKGDPKVEIGIFFEAAQMADIKLFNVTDDFSAKEKHYQNKISLLPQRVRKPLKKVHDEF